MKSATVKEPVQLLPRKASNRKKKPMLDWIGGLKEYRNQYTALELQKRALEWRD